MSIGRPRMGDRKKRPFTVRLSPQDYERLEIAAEMAGLSMAEKAREMIQASLRRSVPLKGSRDRQESPE